LSHALSPPTLFFFFVVLGFELRAYTFGRFASPFM
jgi:hypothetical protein